VKGLTTLFGLLLLGEPLSAQTSIADSLATRQLDEVVITGQFRPQSLSKSVYQVRVIDREIVKLRNATSVQAILNTEPGVRFSNDPVLGTSGISLMGMGGQNVKILMDGVPLVDRGGTKESLNQIDVNTIEQVEIVEGPMSVMYGTDALAGVINIVTKKNREEEPAFSLSAKVMEETVAEEYNAFSNKGVHQENVSGHWQGEIWDLSGGVTRNNFGGWQGSAAGRAKEWLPKEQWLGNISVGINKDQLNVWYRLNYLNENIITTGDINPNTQVATDREYITNRYTHQVQGNWQMNDDWSFNGIASFQDYARKTLTTTLNTTTNDRRLSLEDGAQDLSEFTSTVFRGTVVNKLSKALSLQSGVDINLNSGSGDRIDGTRTINDYALFVSGEITPSSTWNIRPGIRFTHNSVYDAPWAIPSLNFKVSVSDRIDFRGSYARGFRAPALRELHFTFHDANHDIDGNPNLKAEYSNSFNTSLTWKAIRKPSFILNAAAGGFYNEFDNLISLALSPENPNLYTYINVFRNKTTGGTLTASALWKNLQATTSFYYLGVYNQYSEDDGALPALLWMPEISSSLIYSIDKIGTSINLFYKFTGNRSAYQAATTVDNEQVVALATIEAFQWADLSLSKKINDFLDVSAGVKNLFDVTRLQNSSQAAGGTHTDGGAVSMSYGRSYFVTLNCQWKGKSN
jgi:outer membrane receptor for ferrienterochelin and colicins